MALIWAVISNLHYRQNKKTYILRERRLIYKVTNDLTFNSLYSKNLTMFQQNRKYNRRKVIYVMNTNEV